MGIVTRADTGFLSGGMVGWETNSNLNRLENFPGFALKFTRLVIFRGIDTKNYEVFVTPRSAQGGRGFFL